MNSYDDGARQLLEEVRAEQQSLGRLVGGDVNRLEERIASVEKRLQAMAHAAHPAARPEPDDEEDWDSPERPGHEPRESEGEGISWSEEEPPRGPVSALAARCIREGLELAIRPETSWGVTIEMRRPGEEGYRACARMDTAEQAAGLLLGSVPPGAFDADDRPTWRGQW
jgi:hypothetical protein